MNNIEIIKADKNLVFSFFLKDPKLLIMSSANKDPKVSDMWFDDCNYIAIIDKTKNDVVGLGNLRHVNNITVDCHLWIRTKYQATKESISFAKSGLEWVNKYTNYKNIVIGIPNCCYHVKKFIQKLNFNKIGIIPQGIKWKDKLEDIHIYNYKETN